ncbi:MAG: hypothetical protein ACRCY2_00695, partial [Bombilactobacillus sp.]
MKGGIIMEFSIEAFKQCPTVEALRSCRKSDLILVADYYDIAISKVAAKQAIRDVVQENLVSAGVLKIEPELQDVGAEASVQIPTADSDPLVGLKTEDLKLAIRLKELDLQVKRQEHDTQL